jgi:hypothetical protein
VATWAIKNAFKEEIGDETHDLAADTLMVMLTNTAPSVANSVKADLTEIAAGFGYAAGGTALAGVTFSQTGGTATLAFGTNLTFTAAGGAIADFRYLELYNDTAANDELIGHLDYGATVSLADGQSFTLTAGTIFTLA